ncbi:hypothetical protein MMC14_004081 [Varicellaria rhodocarpa]|nr:hypothetical protein [Varicellaria rhodocarpa]
MPINILGSLRRGFASLAEWVAYSGASSDKDPLSTTRPDASQRLNRSIHARNLTICAIFSKRFALPIEITTEILDQAESWTCQFDQSRKDWPSLIQPICVENAEKIMAFSKQLESSEIRKLRKVQFRFVSKDQGWSNHQHTLGGTYEGSSSWWELKIQRAKPRKQVGRTNTAETEEMAAEGEVSQLRRASSVAAWENVESLYLRANKHAGQKMERYDIQVNSGHEVFEHLQPGDRIVLCACARYPRWKNFVESAIMILWFKDTID